MMFGDLLKISRWLALGAIFFCAMATLIAYFSLDILEVLIKPLMGTGVFLWVLSVIWFLWGWLRNANDESNEGKGVWASTYILLFLPLCYCFLMATDDARTKITVQISNHGEPVHSVKIFGKGNIFLNQDTLKLAGLAREEETNYRIKASIDPNRILEGEILMEYFSGPEKKLIRVAGPFKTSPQWELKQEWSFELKEARKNGS
jgi:hypothetical protein